MMISGEIWSRLAMRWAISERISGGKRDQQRGRLRGIQMREHQRDGLGMLVVNELGELLGVGFLDGVEGGGLRPQRLGEPVEHPLGDVRREGAQQQLAREIDAAARDVIAGQGQLVELFEHAPRPVRRRWP